MANVFIHKLNVIAFQDYSQKTLSWRFGKVPNTTLLICPNVTKLKYLPLT